MAIRVDGTAFLRTNSRAKAEKLVARLEAAFECELVVESLDVHHGGDFYELRFRLPFVATDEAAIALEVLRRIGKLAPSCHVLMLREPGRLCALVTERDSIVVAGVSHVELDVFVDTPTDWAARPSSL